MLAIFPFAGAGARQRLQQRWAKRLLAILAVDLHASGPPIERGCLVIANHISWLDIFVIAALAPAVFVSKAEVRRWPLIGWLAAKNDTVFLRRGSRGHARIINTEIAVLLGRGRNVALFPEGTTTDGYQVLHFHAALLQPAIECGQPVQPIAISYHEPDGTASRAPAFHGDVSLVACLGAILAAPRLVARAQVFAPQPTDATTDRRALAHAARHAIVGALGHTDTGGTPATTKDTGPPRAKPVG